MQTDVLSLNELARLRESTGGPKVTLYMPTVIGGPATRENALRCKNLVHNAETQLVATGLRPDDARQILAPAWELVINLEFWQQQGSGLALFMDSGGMKSVRLPYEPIEVAIVAEAFSTKPLLPLFTDTSFYVLPISLRSVRLYNATRFSIAEVDVPDLPKGIDEALWPDQIQDERQFHTTNTGISGRGDAVYHGTGDDAQDRRKEDILRYMQTIEDALQPVLAAKRQALVLACVDYLKPLFLKATSYHHVLDTAIKGNPDGISPEELREKAWELVAPYAKSDARS